MSDLTKDLHEAIEATLDPNEIAIQWIISVEVAGENSARYLVTRGGGGHDGSDEPMSWTVLGLLEASAAIVREHIVDLPEDGDDE